MFDGHDACGGDDWQVYDVPKNDRDSTVVKIIATHFKPYTQYAYFIRTYTIASEPRVGITPIKYFQTTRKPVTDISATVDGSSKNVRPLSKIENNHRISLILSKVLSFLDDQMGATSSRPSKCY